MTTDTISGTCECGAGVSRPRGDGIFAAAMDRVPFVCDTCHDEFVAAAEAAEAAKAAALARTRTRQRIAGAGIPSQLRIERATPLDRTGNEEAFASVARWSAGELRGVLLTGDPGTGKTTLAAAGLMRLLQRADGHWISAPELLLRLSSSFGGRERTDAMDALLGNGALVLDDIDKIRPTEYGAEQLFVAIDHCIAHGRPLLVTTNMNLGGIAERYPSSHGDAIASRLAGLPAAHRMTGRDRRIA